MYEFFALIYPCWDCLLFFLSDQDHSIVFYHFCFPLSKTQSLCPLANWQSYLKIIYLIRTFIQRALHSDEIYCELSPARCFFKGLQLEFSSYTIIILSMCIMLCCSLWAQHFERETCSMHHSTLIIHSQNISSASTACKLLSIGVIALCHNAMYQAA